MPRTKQDNEKLKEIAKEKIIDAAIDVFANKGYALTSISDIAYKANISVGLMYRYFKSKQDLFKSIVDYATDGLNNLTMYLNSDENPLEIITNVINSCLNDLDNKDYVNLHMTLIHAISTCDNNLVRNVIEADKKMFNAMSNLIKRGQNQKIFKEGDSMRFTMHIFSSIQGMVFLKFSLKDDFKKSTVEDVISLII